MLPQVKKKPAQSEIVAIAAAARVAMMEQHYSISEIAEKWNCSHNYVLHLFQDEPGVIKAPGKRGFIRVPASVLERVYLRLQIQKGA